MSKRENVRLLGRKEKKGGYKSAIQTHFSEFNPLLARLCSLQEEKYFRGGRGITFIKFFFESNPTKTIVLVQDIAFIHLLKY